MSNGTDGKPQIVFFDALGALGAESADWRGERFARFESFDWVTGVLAALAPRARLGVLATDPNIPRKRLVDALGRAGLFQWIGEDLVVVAERRETDRFATALEATGMARLPEQVLYVGPDAVHRSRAVRARMRASPHALLAPAAVAGESLHYVRVSAPVGSPPDWGSLVAGLSLVPVLIDVEPEPTLYAVASTSAVKGLEAAFPTVERLGEPAHVALADLYLYQVTPEEEAASDPLRRFLRTLPDRLSHGEPPLPPLVRRVPRGWLVAIPGGIPGEALHPPDAGHGHTVALTPSPGSVVSVIAPAAPEARALGADEKSALGRLDAGLYGKGLEPGDGGSSIPPSPNPSGSTVSRNVFHPGNAKAVNALAAALGNVCGAAHVRRIPFSQWGWTFENVEAEIPGTSTELVIVGAHLDSTAAEEPSYDPQKDAAPGADDDGSGVAGVLAAAKVLKELSDATAPRRTVRFVLFNAEEYGMVGSEWYAEQLKTVEKKTVAAMFQLDMIGWVSGSKIVEVHGTGSADYAKAQPASAALRDLVVAAAAEVSPALVPETYPVANCDRDPAAHRSDHTSFHYHGWPACLVAEDLWTYVCTGTKQTGNPAWHLASDLAVDSAYAADVTRAVTAAAWLVAV